MRNSMRSWGVKILQKIPVPLSRPIFTWDVIKVAWELRGTSDRELCRLLGICRVRLRQRRDRGNWRRKHLDRISTLRVVARRCYGLGLHDAGDNLERAADRREREFEIAVLRCAEMICDARERGNAARRR